MTKYEGQRLALRRRPTPPGWSGPRVRARRCPTSPEHYVIGGLYKFGTCQPR